jgi:putative endopeptidase
VAAGAYFNNSLLANAAKVLRDLSLLDQVPDRARWNMQSWAVNAYYDNTVNSVFIPAGILQPPFFNESARMEQNFGSVGAVIGHEITHGFDNLGSRFDSEENVRDWWSPHVAEEFHKRMQCIADLYSGFQIADSQVVGARTLGENMADFGGTKIAHQALLEWYQQTTGQPTSVAGERLFFVSFAQLWCEKGRKRSLQSRVLQARILPSPLSQVLSTVIG